MGDNSQASGEAWASDYVEALHFASSLMFDLTFSPTAYSLLKQTIASSFACHSAWLAILKTYNRCPSQEVCSGLFLRLLNVDVFCHFTVITMPSPQYHLKVDNETIATLNINTSTVTAQDMGDTEIKLKDKRILVCNRPRFPASHRMRKCLSKFPAV